VTITHAEPPGWILPSLHFSDSSAKTIFRLCIILTWWNVQPTHTNAILRNYTTLF